MQSKHSHAGLLDFNKILSHIEEKRKKRFQLRLLFLVDSGLLLISKTTFYLF